MLLSPRITAYNPDAAFPDFLEDAAAAVAWTMKHIGAYGKATDFFIGGSSAGGYITQMLCFDKRYLRQQGIDADHLSGYIMDAGQPTTHFRVLQERGFDSRRVLIDDAAPLYFIDQNKDYPPMLILVADRDMTNRYEQTMLLVQTLKHFSCPPEKIELKIITNSGHCEYHSWKAANGRNYFGEIVRDFIDRNSKR